MQFEMWSAWHFLYMLGPFIILGILHMVLKSKSEKTIHTVGMIIGIISLSILSIRNIDIIVKNGFDPQAIPLQVCHLGNIIVFVALVFKNKTFAAIAFCFNLPFAFAAIIVPNVLENFSTIWQIRAQAHIWGHLSIVVGAAYPVLFNTVRFKLKHVLKGLWAIIIIFVIAMIMNLILIGLGWTINYFYAFDASDVPFKVFENLATEIDIIFKNSNDVFVSWNYVYTLCVMGVGIATYFIMYPFSRVIYKLGKGQSVGDGNKAVE